MKSELLPHSSIPSDVSLGHTSLSDRDSVNVVISLFFYLVFLGIFSYAFHLQRPNTAAYYFADGLKDLFIRDDINATFHVQPLTFEDLDHYLDIWNYLKGGLLQHALVGTYYNFEPLPPERAYKYIMRYNRLLGGISLRTMRVQQGSCEVPSVFSSMIEDCLDDLTSDNEETAPYGPGGIWKWGSSSDLRGYNYMGFHNSYRGSGYAVDLPLNRTEAMDFIEFLQDNVFIDHQTRVIFIDFTIYNSALNLFCIVRLGVELPASGGFHPVATFRTLKLFNYLRSEDFFRLFFEILVVIGNVVCLIVALRKLKRQGFSQYFGSFWHLIDSIRIIVLFCIFGLRIYAVYTLSSTSTRQAGYTESDAHVYQSVGFLMNQELNIMSVVAFLMWFNLFKFLDLSNRLSLLTKVLKSSAKDVAAFAVIFGIIFMGYAFAGRLAFGIDVYEYRSMKHSFLSLFRMVVGDFDYDSIFLANRAIGPFFIISFMFLVFFILLNMFLAIINDTFTVVREQEAQNKEDVLFNTLSSLTKSFRRKLTRKFEPVNMRRNPLLHILSGKDSINSIYLEDYFKQFKDERHSLFGDLPTSDIVSQFDSNGDGVLSKSEFKKLQKRIEAETSFLQEQQLFKMWQQAQFEKFKAGVETDKVVASLGQRMTRMEGSLASMSASLMELNSLLKKSRYSR
ncbi:hypothetical protein P9112_006769 [Eukaryota sp. TZLM1-RC]